MAECGTQQKSLLGLSRFRYVVALDKDVYPSTENNDIKILVLAAKILPINRNMIKKTPYCCHFLGQAVSTVHICEPVSCFAHMAYQGSLPIPRCDQLNQQKAPNK